LGNDVNALIGKRFRRCEPRFRFRGTSLHTCLDPTAAAAPVPVPVRPWGSVLTFYAAVRPFAAPVPSVPADLSSKSRPVALLLCPQVRK
jgi:hypothetical protein